MLIQHLRLDKKKLPKKMTSNTRWRKELRPLIRLLNQGDIDLIYFGKVGESVQGRASYVIERVRSGERAAFRLCNISASGQRSKLTYYSVDDDGVSEVIEDMMARAIAWFCVQQAQCVRFPKLGTVDESDYSFKSYTFL
jgi:hypothetical protein